uniref:Uncharacterized protein n=1 Tax=Ditylenchus dipsaci TaxID=166011 RepID=A0A915E0P5_9BILA
MLNFLEFLNPLSRNCMELRRAVVKAMTQLAVGTPASLQRYVHIFKQLMSFEPIVIKDIVGYLIHSIGPDERQGFRNMLVQIRAHLDFSVLQKPSNDFSESVDHVVYGIFDHILTFFELMWAKPQEMFKLALHGTRKNNEMGVYEVDSDEEFFEEATLDANIDDGDNSNCSTANASKRSSRHLDVLLTNLEKALTFKKFNVVFLASMLKLAMTCCAPPKIPNPTCLPWEWLSTNNCLRTFLTNERTSSPTSDPSKCVPGEECSLFECSRKIAESDASSLMPFQSKFLEMLDQLLSKLSIENSRQLVGKLDAYLKADSSQQHKIWGMLGLLMYIKALLTIFEGEEQRTVEKQVEKTLNKLAHLTKGCYPVRAEMFSQLQQLVKEHSGFSPALNFFGTRLFDNFRRDYFIEDENYAPQGGFEAAKYVNSDSTLWLPINTLIFSTAAPTVDQRAMDGPVLQLIPLFLLLKEFAVYEQEAEESTILKPPASKFIFLLEANLSFTKPAGASDQSTLHRCHMLYFAVEWLRTVLNMFSDSELEHVPVNELLMKKFDLLVECQSQLLVSVKKLKEYTLPDLTKQLARPAKGLHVHYQQNANMRRLRHAGLQLNNQPNEPEVVELDDDQHRGGGGANLSESFLVVQLQANRKNEQKARKAGINVENCYGTALPSRSTLSARYSLLSRHAAPMCESGDAMDSCSTTVGRGGNSTTQASYSKSAESSGYSVQQISKHNLSTQPLHIDTTISFDESPNLFGVAPQIERLTALQWLIVHQLNTVVEDQSHKSRHVFVLDTLIERGELVDKYKGRHWPAFNPPLSLLSTNSLIYWRTAIQCYVYLLVSTKVKELRSVPLLSSCVREGRKFMSFICSKQSTFMSLLDKQNISHFPNQDKKTSDTVETGTQPQSHSELFLKEIRKALKEAGLAEAISIVDGQNEDSADQQQTTTMNSEPAAAVETSGNSRKRRAPQQTNSAL